MKDYHKFFTLVLALLITTSIFAQTAVVNYMRLKGTQDDYMAIEKQWKTLHEQRIKDGLSIGWQLYQVMYSGTDDPYHYMTVDTYENMAKTVGSYTDEVVQKVFPNGMDDLMQKTGESRDLTRSEVYHLITESLNESNTPSNFIVVNFFKVPQGEGQAYQDLEKNIFKPMHEAAIKNGKRTYWGVWVQWPNPGGEYNYVAVDGYEKLEHLNASDYDELFQTVHAGKDADEAWKNMNEARMSVKTQIFRLVDSVLPPPPQ